MFEVSIRTGKVLRMSWHKRLLSADAEAGYREWYCTDDDGNVAIQTEWFVDPILEIAKAEYNAFSHKSVTKFKDDVLNHVGFIPKYVIDYEWRVNGRKMLADKEYVRHWLNQPENKAFRTKPGRI